VSGPIDLIEHAIDAIPASLRDAAAMTSTRRLGGSVVDSLIDHRVRTQDPTRTAAARRMRSTIVIPSLPGLRLFRQADRPRLGPRAHSRAPGRS